MNGFTAINTLTLPLLWPLPFRSRAIQISSGKLSLEIWYTEEGRIFIQVLDKESGEIRQKMTSQKIEISGIGEASIICTIVYENEENCLNLFVNGIKMAWHEKDLLIESNSTVKYYNNITLTKNFDEIENSLKVRRSEIESKISKKLDKELFFKERKLVLETESRLLSSYIMSIESGDLAFVIPISVSLRKLIGPGRGNRVLQDCAALSGASLPVWRRPGGQVLYPLPADLEPEFRIQFGNIKLQPSEKETELTDLDAWMSDEMAFIRGSKLTHMELLKTVADKIGAHADLEHPKILKSIDDFTFGNLS